jgi:hypothetical protein
MAQGIKFRVIEIGNSQIQVNLNYKKIANTLYRGASKLVAASNSLETITTVAQNGNCRPSKGSTKSALSHSKRRTPNTKNHFAHFHGKDHPRICKMKHNSRHEDRTRMYRYPERRLRVQQFDCHLPEESRAEMGQSRR